MYFCSVLLMTTELDTGELDRLSIKQIVNYNK